MISHELYIMSITLSHKVTEILALIMAHSIARNFEYTT